MMTRDWRTQLLVAYLRITFVRRCYAKLRALPILGWALHSLARVVIPNGTRVWLQIPSGEGKGLWMHLDSRFEIDYASGNYEPMIETLLLSSLRSGDIFYDVGAHIGLFSLLAARRVGKSGSVFAFEADPENAERIREHANRNGLKQIHVIECAVWSSPGRLSFVRVPVDSSRNQGAVVDNPSIYSEATIEVRSVSLDNFVQEHLRPTLIKIDVEGGEADVLVGSRETLKSSTPLVICEVHNQRAADCVVQCLRSNGYAFDWVEKCTNFPRHLFAHLAGHVAQHSPE